MSYQQVIDELEALRNERRELSKALQEEQAQRREGNVPSEAPPNPEDILLGGALSPAARVMRELLRRTSASGA